MIFTELPTYLVIIPFTAAPTSLRVVDGNWKNFDDRGNKNNNGTYKRTYIHTLSVITPCVWSPVFFPSIKRPLFPCLLCFSAFLLCFCVLCSFFFFTRQSRASPSPQPKSALKSFPSPSQGLHQRKKENSIP